MTTSLAHRVEGSGAPLVLLNGGMMTFASWQPVAVRLETSYRVLRFDFRGQLLSPGEPPAELAGHAADLLALLDEAGYANAHLVGASFGALVAVEFAANHPERVRSLALVTAMDRATVTFRSQSDGMRAILADVAAGGDREPFWDVMVAGVYSRPYLEREREALAARCAQLGLLPATWFTGVDRLLAAVEAFDLTPALARIHRPSLVIAAADDQVMDAARSRVLAESLGADLVTHPTAGHALVAEDPAWLAQTLEQFLERSERRAS